MISKSECIGEVLGTFILTLFGCGAVATSILFEAHVGLMQLALIWGIGVTLAIYLTRHLSCAHLNPAVSVAMVLSGRMGKRKLIPYCCAQFLGAFLAGLMIYGLFHISIRSFELEHEILRGSTESVKTAKMFGEYYIEMPLMMAMMAEAVGSFLLVLIIFSLTEGCNAGRPDDKMTPIFIGLAVTSIICLIAPLTQAGLNPARDFSPRMVAWLYGWGDAAFPDQSGGFFWVYVLAPCVGGGAAALFFTYFIEPAMKDRSKQKKCCE